MLPLFAGTIFLGAALLFLVQPMIARMILPLLGGSPSVWNGCMLFFQGALLAGYLYAHLVGSMRRLGPQTALHGGVLLASVGLLAVFPPGIPADAVPPAGSQVVWMLAALAQGIGIPFLMLSTGSSLLQRFFSQTDHPAAADPYFLYSASNAGSMVGLLGYPILIEPAFTLGQQRWLFAAGYVLWTVFTVVCGLAAMKRRAQVVPDSGETTTGDRARTAITLAVRARWVLLAFVPSSLLLSVTLFITTDVAAAPFLWVIPLAIYLLTFIIAFSLRGEPIVRWAGWLLLPAVAVLVVVVATAIRTPLTAIVAVHLAVLLLGGLACHGRLAATRPAAASLTEFYLWIAVGGVLGGLFNALAAPMIFDSVDEYAVALALLCVVAIPNFPRVKPLWGLAARTACGAAAGIALFVAGRSSGVEGAEVIYRERTFFGIYRVVSLWNGYAHSLYHGTTLHGRQAFGDRNDPQDQRKRFMPMTYYHFSGPVGIAMQMRWDAEPSGWDEVGIVGLGVGTLAAYGERKSQRFTFYEIDPAVERIASNPTFFTYLSDSDATVSTVIGDARLMLAREPDGRFDLLVVDAFSSDAIPIHLITREAHEMYLSKLKPSGILAVHVTNRHLNLAPVVGSIARSLGAAAFLCQDWTDRGSEQGKQELREGKTVSTWVLVTRDAQGLAPVAAQRKWVRYEQGALGRPWTDDYSNIMGVMTGH